MAPAAAGSMGGFSMGAEEKKSKTDGRKIVKARRLNQQS
jgi:hypothetical protein